MSSQPNSEGKYSLDTIFNGAVSIRQSCRGYRFSVDAILLAWYAFPLPGPRLLDIGTGSGVISLALAHQRPGLEITAVERQESLAEVARENFRRNGQEGARLLQADFRDLTQQFDGEHFELLVSNPPFREQGRGRLNPDPEKAAARHELHGTLADLLEVADDLLASAGAIALVLLAERYDDLLAAITSRGLHISQITWIHPFDERPANLFLVCLTRRQEQARQSRLAIWERVGCYTPRLSRILAGDWRGDHPLLPVVERLTVD